ncbi:hypothetical protein P261_00615 [Lachnospiraceae bacterium TWA4]|nr:hypothetical protein P261_00615 [Lachnospiraceae bacterium TWA4]
MSWKKESRVDKARELFRQGYNCCQAVVLAYSDLYGIDDDVALKFACSFGGGMGRMKEVCGAVCGMAMIAGLETGNIDPKNVNAKQDNYEMVRYLMNEFKKENGAIMCKDLIGLDGVEEGTRIQDREFGYYAKKPCLEYIADAAKILEKQFF